MATKLTPTGIQFNDATTIDTRTWLFQSSTSWVFYQASAPTGWTKQDHNDKALRVVSGSGGVSDGSTAFTTVLRDAFAYQGTLTTTDATGLYALGTGGTGNSEMPFHSHPVGGITLGAVPAVYNPDGSFNYWNGGDVGRAANYGNNGGFVQSTPPTTYGPTSPAGYGHQHPVSGSGYFSTPFTTGVQYIDVLVCTFNG